MRIPSITCAVLILFLLTPRSDTYAQPGSPGMWQVEGSAGFFSPDADVSGPGHIVSVAIGRHLSTGFLVSGQVGIAHTSDRYRMDDLFLPGGQFYSTHYIFHLRFQYPITLGTRHRIGLNSGVMYRRYYRTYLGEDTGSDYGGLLAGLQYGIDLRPLLVGVRMDSHFRYDDGFGDYTIAPFVGLEM